MIRSLYRDADKLYKSENPDLINNYKNKLEKQKKEIHKLQEKYYDVQNKNILLNQELITNRLCTTIDNRLMTYKEWCPILEQENNMKILDDDGYNQLKRDKKTEDKLTRQEASNYFMMCTVEFNIFGE